MKDVSKLNDLRTFAIAAPYLMPLLERRKSMALKSLIAKYRMKEDITGTAAEIAVIDDLENELKRKHIELQNMQEEER
jgi:predicted HTH domain antitoxin